MPLERMSSRFCGVQQAQEAHSLDWLVPAASRRRVL